MKAKTTNRRRFLLNGLLAAAATAAPLATNAGGSGKTVKMLTPDGKLVVVDQDVLNRASKQKVTNKEILEWRSLKG